MNNNDFDHSFVDALNKLAETTKTQEELAKESFVQSQLEKHENLTGSTQDWS